MFTKCNHFLMTMCVISFIIPVYNGHSTIERCIDSITRIGLPENQFEIIVVDDCSTDNTLKVLNELAYTHPNMLVIAQQVNKKAGGARNTGLSKAQGEYIMFVDADDEVGVGLKNALSNVVGTGIDILSCRFQKQREFNSEFYLASLNTLEKQRTVNGKVYCQKYYRANDHMGAYLFRGGYLKRMQHPFVEGLIFEDMDWVEYHVYHCDTIRYDDSVIYSNYATPGSILHSLNFTKDADVVLFCYRRLCFAKSVEDVAPQLYQKVFPFFSWVPQTFSFRHMTRHTRKSARRLFDTIGSEALSFFEDNYQWKGFNRICVKHPSLAVLIVAVVHPITHFGRTIVCMLRQNKL